jgi:GTP-dependent phosphoenolpyruvate carboxykinase
VSNQEKHKVTWFQRDERGNWQWQGFRDDLDTDEKMQAWVDEMQAKEGAAVAAEEPWQEVFIIDLENANQILVNLMSDSQELEDLKEWLDKVVRIDKITVEQDFNEFCEAKYGEDEDNE